MLIFSCNKSEVMRVSNNSIAEEDDELFLVVLYPEVPFQGKITSCYRIGSTQDIAFKISSSLVSQCWRPTHFIQTRVLSRFHLSPECWGNVSGKFDCPTVLSM